MVTHCNERIEEFEKSPLLLANRIVINCVHKIKNITAIGCANCMEQREKKHKIFSSIDTKVYLCASIFKYNV
jgi:hypothetical protein